MYRGLFEITGDNCLETFKSFLADFYPEGKIYTLGDGLVCVADRNRWFTQYTAVTIIAKGVSGRKEQQLQVIIFGGESHKLLGPSRESKTDITDTYEYMQTQLFRFPITFTPLTIRED